MEDSEAQSSEGAVTFLKECTQKVHDRLEDHPLLAQLLDETLSDAEYARILSGLYQVIAPWELLLTGFSAAESIPDRNVRFRCEALQLDLMDLGTAVECDYLRIHFRPDFSFLRTTAAMYGALYVIEGSSLGSQSIASAVRSHHGKTLPLRYFSGQGKETMRYWKSLCKFLDKNLKLQHERDVAGEAARAMFARIEQAMDMASSHSF